MVEVLNYKVKRALFTDFYEITMMAGYYDVGIHKKEAVFDLFFRTNPFNGSYAIAGGIKEALEYVKFLKFTDDDIRFLSQKEVFSDDFLEYLVNFEFSGDISGVRDGQVVFANVPIITVKGPLIEAQIVESALLNIINYSTLIATKTARICHAAQGGGVWEFGLRRAQGDGSYLGVKAAMIGGASGTSFVDGGKKIDAPITGTHAHSWIEAFDTEFDAFKAYADVFPDSCLLLVDTYDTLRSGVPNAIKIARYLREKGKELVGIRIDSGDLAYLSIEAYRQFIDAGFEDISIVLSNELDEKTINSIVHQIKNGFDKDNKEEERLRQKLLNHLLYGVGTRLITGGVDDIGQPALGGVYKLVAFDGKPKIKISENRAKTTNPGKKRIWRIRDKNGHYIADVLDIPSNKPPQAGGTIYHPIETMKQYSLPDKITVNELHEPLMVDGKIKIDLEKEDWKKGQQRANKHLGRLHATHKRILNPYMYKVSLTKSEYELKQRLMKEHHTSD